MTVSNAINNNDNFVNYKQELDERFNENISDHKVFEYFCAEHIIPRLHPENFYPETDNYLEKALTPYHDKGIDIDYANIVAQCKFKDIKNKKDINEIVTPLKEELDKRLEDNDSDYSSFHSYLFCKTITPQAKIMFEDAFKGKYNGAIKARAIQFKDADELYKNSKTNEYIDLVISTSYRKISDTQETERTGGITSLYQGDRHDKEIHAGMATIAADRLIEALNKVFNDEIQERYRELFSDNIRSYLDRKTQTNKGILATIKECPEKFCMRNNGIVILCNAYKGTFLDQNGDIARHVPKKSGGGVDYHKLDDQGISAAISLTGAQIINGAQTIGTIISYYLTEGKNNKDETLNQLSKVRIPVKLIAGDIDSDSRQDIIKYHNTQNSVAISDFYSNTPLQENIKKSLNKHGIYYQVKAGEIVKKNIKKSDILEPKGLVNIILWSNAKHMSPSNAYNSQNFFTNIPYKTIAASANEKFINHYDEIFSETDNSSSWSIKYSKDIAHLSKEYREIKKGYSKQILPDFQGSRHGMDHIILMLFAAYYFQVSKNFPNQKSDDIKIIHGDFKIVCKNALEFICEKYLEIKKSDTIGGFIRDDLRKGGKVTAFALQMLESQTAKLII